MAGTRLCLKHTHADVHTRQAHLRDPLGLHSLEEHRASAAVFLRWSHLTAVVRSLAPWLRGGREEACGKTAMMCMEKPAA